MPIDRKQLSKTLSHVLRHAPWLYELELDDEGWVPVDEVLAALRVRSQWADLTEDDLAEMIEQSDKRRFEMRGGRIRALYGHSVPGKLKKTPAVPPDVLFHGTSPRVVEKITSTGLKPMRRQFVHLSIDEPTALEVGRRKDRTPVILRIRAREAHEVGVSFYEGNERVWLADSVPPEFIEVAG